MKTGNWPAVRAIYQEGIDTGNVTFEAHAPAWEQQDADHIATRRLVAWDGEHIVGWTALSPVSSHCVYAGVAEVSVYVAAVSRRQGTGKALLEALIEASERKGIQTLQAGVLCENQASIALHQRCGFRIVGRREKIGLMHGVWQDVMLLERRSQVTGI